MDLLIYLGIVLFFIASIFSITSFVIFFKTPKEKKDTRKKYLIYALVTLPFLLVTLAFVILIIALIIGFSTGTIGM